MKLINETYETATINHLAAVDEFQQVQLLSEKNRKFKREFQHLNFKIIVLLVAMMSSILIQTWFVIQPTTTPVIASNNSLEIGKTDVIPKQIARQKTGK